ncbi:MAG: DUF2971 domain-containing protein [Sarcina sp.]
MEKEYLYHFTTVESLIKILLTDKFRLSSVDYMNDVNESLPLYEVFDRSEEEIQKEKDDRARTFLGCFNILKPNENIRDKSSLWGHYANGATGVCIKVDKMKFDDLITNIQYDMQYDATNTNVHTDQFRINYKKESEIYNHKKICSNGTSLPDYIELNYLYSKKSEEWKIENEYRYLIYNADWQHMSYYFIEKFSNTIDAIYIGQKNNEDDLLRSIKSRLAKNVKFYKMNKQREEIELL